VEPDGSIKVDEDECIYWDLLFSDGWTDKEEDLRKQWHKKWFEKRKSSDSQEFGHSDEEDISY